LSDLEEKVHCLKIPKGGVSGGDFSRHKKMYLLKFMVLKEPWIFALPIWD
jgi:hypothetical protein